MMWHWSGWWGWWGWWWTWLVWIFLIALIIWAVSSSRTLRYRGGRDLAEDIVRQRYARGEITSEEYERLLNDLRRR